MTRTDTVNRQEQRAWTYFSAREASAFAAALARECGTSPPSSEVEREARFESFCGQPVDAADLERRLARICDAWIAVREGSHSDAATRAARNAATAMTLMVAINAIPKERRESLRRMPELQPAATTLLVAAVILAARFNGEVEFDESGDVRRPTPRGVRRVGRLGSGTTTGAALLIQILKDIDPASRVTEERLDAGGDLTPADAARLRARVRTILKTGRKVAGWVVSEQALRDLAPGHTLRSEDIPLVLVGDDPELFRSIFIGDAHTFVAMIEEFFMETHSGAPGEGSGAGRPRPDDAQSRQPANSSTQWNVTLESGASANFNSASGPGSTASQGDVTVGGGTSRSLGAPELDRILAALKLAVEEIVEGQVRKQLAALVADVETEPAPKSESGRATIRDRFRQIATVATTLVLVGNSVEASEKIAELGSRAIEWIDKLSTGLSGG